MHRNFRSLSKVIFVSLMLIALVSVTSMGLFWILQVSFAIQTQYNTISHDYLEKEKSLIKNRVLELVQRIEAQLDELDDVIENHIRENNRLVVTVIDSTVADMKDESDVQYYLSHINKILESFHYQNGEPYHLVIRVNDDQTFTPFIKDFFVEMNCLAPENGYRSINDFYQAVYDYSQQEKSRFYFYTKEGENASVKYSGID